MIFTKDRCVSFNPAHDNWQSTGNRLQQRKRLAFPKRRQHKEIQGLKPRDRWSLPSGKNNLLPDSLLQRKFFEFFARHAITHKNGFGPQASAAQDGQRFNGRLVIFHRMQRGDRAKDNFILGKTEIFSDNTHVTSGAEKIVINRIRHHFNQA